jgi:hypothetical protein
MNYPKIDDDIYKEIKNIEDYEYTSCIAFEMAIRNEKVKNLIRKVSKLNEIRDNFVFEKLNENCTISERKEKYKLINNELVVNQIKEKLLNSYMFDYASIYKPTSGTYRMTKELANHIFNLVSNSLEIDKKPVANSFTNIRKSDFFEIHQSYNIKKNKYISKLYLKKYRHLGYENKKVSIDFDLNLPKDELIAYISKIKDEYDKDNSIIKSPLELLGEELEKADEIKSKVLPNDKQKRKKAMAEAFYVYDIYKILEAEYKHKTKELRTERDEKIDIIKKDKFNYDSSQKKSKIEDLKEYYSDEIRKYDKPSLKAEIQNQSNLSLDDIEKYMALLNKYIEQLRYKELITGVTN